MLEDAKSILEHIREGLSSKAKSFDLEARRADLQELEEQSNAPDLWDNSASAQALMQKLSAAREFVTPFTTLEQRTRDLVELIELAQVEDDPELGKEIERDLQDVQSEYSKLEMVTLFGGEYDTSGAIFSINAGAGGTEAQDWAQMLVRAYIRWAQRHDYKLEILEESAGEEAGIKGFPGDFSRLECLRPLESRSGVHRLVRISPLTRRASA
jgi:peptide chain release factor 2